MHDKEEMKIWSYMIMVVKYMHYVLLEPRIKRYLSPYLPFFTFTFYNVPQIENCN